MSYIFTANFEDTSSEDLPEFQFNDIDELVDHIDVISGAVDFFDMEADSVKITMIDFDDIAVDQRDNLITFLSEFDELNYDLMVEIGDGGFDEYWEDEGNKFYAYQYLISNCSLSAEDAIEKVNEVGVFNGSAEEYAEQYVDDMFDIPPISQKYFDYGNYAHDLIRDGELVEVADNVYITNGNQW